MFTTTVLVVAVAAALIIGAGIGWLLGAQRRPAHRNVIEDLESRLEQAVSSRSDYEAEVREHFSRTAELLNRLSEDYRSVYQHIASGADQLCDGEVVVPADALTRDQAGEIPSQLIDVQAPLDYAPRKSADEEGQLSEAFGLEKSTTPEPVEDRETEPVRASA
jgi:uncharacterized membrane-anchored protein YhcB (DUF1043 family)